MKLSTDYDADFEETDPEDKDVKPVTKLLVFLGLIAAAAVICAVLWNVTHSDKKDGGQDNSPVKGNVEESVPEEDAAGRKPDTQTASGGIGGAAPEEDGKPDSETALGESGESAGSQDDTQNPVMVPEESSGADPEAGSVGSSGSESGAGSGPGEASGQKPEASVPDGTDNDGSGQKTNENAMVFTECEDTVTPKELINLRSTPSTTADNVVTQAANGELLHRNGINNDTGWSRVEFNGQVLYAVSSYLTTDLTAQPPAASPDASSVSTKDGRTIVFVDCDDNISPKMYVNLRLEPSTSEGNDTVHCRLEYGQVVHRTGVSEDSGWSRVEYDGIVLYVVTSYMYVVEE